LNRAVHLWAPEFEPFGGGIAAFSRELADALFAAGASLTVWGKNDRDHATDHYMIRGAGAFGNALRTPVFAGRAIASAAIHRPSFIISTHLNFGPAVGIGARLSGADYAIVAHGIDVHDDLTRSRIQALRRARTIWAVSRWTQGRLARLGINADRVSIVPNTVDDSRFTVGSRPRDLLERYSIRDGDKVILTVGRLHSGEAYKGYDKVLAALPAIRAAVGTVRYLIVGTGDDRPRIEEMARRAGLSEAVTFCGFVSDEELPAHYRLADVFALPSTGEGFGIVFLEAMASGVPVLAGNVDGSVDALADGLLGELVDPGSVESIAAGLIRILRRQGTAWWFDPQALRARVLARYGRDAFRGCVRDAFARLENDQRT